MILISVSKNVYTFLSTKANRIMNYELLIILAAFNAEIELFIKFLNIYEQFEIQREMKRNFFRELVNKRKTESGVEV